MRKVTKFGAGGGLAAAGLGMLVASGVYRDWVCPARGGTDPEHIISYEAAPGARVVAVTASQVQKISAITAIAPLRVIVSGCANRAIVVVMNCTKEFQVP